MKNILPVAFFISALSLVSRGQDSQVQVRVADWFNNCSGAVSISFDDACMSQYAYAYPVLEKYGIKGTFSILGEWVQQGPSYSAEPGHFAVQRM